MPGKTCRRGAGCKYSHNDDDSLQALLRLLNGAERTINACVFNLTCNEIADALEAAAGRGVRVRVISDDDQSESRGSDVMSLVDRGIEVELDTSPAHMHHKFVVVDGRVLGNGSMNWTRSGVLANKENIMFTTHPGTVKAYEAEFEVMWALFAKGADADLPLRSAPKVDCGDGRVALFFPDEGLPCKYHFRKGSSCRRGDRCTYSHKRGALHDFLDEFAAAKDTIDVVVFNLTNNLIKAALLDAKDRGVVVRIVCDDDQATSRGSDIKELAAKGIAVRTDNSPAHMHNKYCIIDGARLCNGSFNWTVGATRENRENIYCCSSPALVSTFAANFASLWEEFEKHAL